MARKKAVITEDMVPVQGNAAKYVALLHRFVAQEGQAALPLLERILDEGSVKMRAAAFEDMLELDVARAEAFALEQADASLHAKKEKERDLQRHWLLQVATPACLDRALALGLKVPRLHAALLERAYDWLPGELLRKRAEGSAANWLSDAVSSLSFQLEGRTARFLLEMIDARGTPPDEKEALLSAFIRVGQHDVCRRPGLPEAMQVDAAFGLPAAECFDTLSPRLMPLSLEDALALFRQGYLMKEPLDDRWVNFWLTKGAPDDDMQVAALQALLDAGRNHQWDGSCDRARAALEAIERPRRRERLLKGLAEASRDYNGEGHRHLFGPLGELETLAHREDLPLLRELAALVWKLSEGSQAPAYWFDKAISAIERRTGK